MTKITSDKQGYLYYNGVKIDHHNPTAIRSGAADAYVSTLAGKVDILILIGVPVCMETVHNSFLNIVGAVTGFGPEFHTLISRTGHETLFQLVSESVAQMPHEDLQAIINRFTYPSVTREDINEV